MNDKPFDPASQESTAIPNVVFDRIMQTLSSDGWKVLCVALRQTWGEAGGQKPEAQIDPGQFVEQSGIQAREAVLRAIDECVSVGYLVRHVIGKDAQSGDPQHIYALNTDFELTDATDLPSPAPEGTKIVAILSPEREQAFQALMEFGQEMGARPDPEQVRKVIMLNEVDAVTAWIETGREMTHLDQPARFEAVLQRLQDRVPPLPAYVLPPDDLEDAVQDTTAPAAAEPEPDAAAAEQLWGAALEELRPKVKRSQFKWFKPTRGIELAGDRLTVAVPNKRTQEWLEEGQFAATIQETVESVVGRPIQLRFEING